MQAVIQCTGVQSTAFVGMNKRSSAQETLGCQQAPGQPACFNQLQIRQARQPLSQRRARSDYQFLSDFVT